MMSTKSDYIKNISLLQKLPIFYQPWWLDVVCKRWEVIVLKEADQIVLVWPYSIEKKWNCTLIRSPQLTSIYGPFCMKEKRNSPLLEKAYRQLPKAIFEQYSPSYILSLSPFFEEKKFSKTLRQTYILCLKDRSTADLFSKIYKKRQYSIKKGDKELTVEETSLNAATFNSWLKSTFEKNNEKYPLNFPLLETLDAAAAANKARLCLSAYDEDHCAIATIWLVFDAQCMYYILSATNPEKKPGNAVALLLWHAICKAKAQHLSYFDFEGSSIASIEQFFKSFGGEKIVYNSYSKASSLLWKIKQKILG